MTVWLVAPEAAVLAAEQPDDGRTGATDTAVGTTGASAATADGTGVGAGEGEESWELRALPPQDIATAITAERAAAPAILRIPTMAPFAVGPER